MRHREIIDLIVKNKAEAVCSGSLILGGHNGPYYDFETPIRNISHWICIFSKYYKITKEEKYIDAIEILSKEFLDKKNLIDGKSCVCRVKCGKDKTNGVMGQAWVIEGLLACADSLKDNQFYKKAVDLFKVQRFDYDRGLWSVIETDGRDLGFDITFNHQLWFAAAGSQIVAYKFDDEINKQVLRFLELAPKFFFVHSNGLVFHFLKYIHDFRSWRWFWRTFHDTDKKLNSMQPSLIYKEEGYHLFSIYAFAIIFENYSDSSFFNLDKVKKAIAFSFEESYLKRLSDIDSSLDNTHIQKNIDKSINAYGYPYNSPAFELPYIDKIFGNNSHEKLIDYLMDEQIRLTYNGIDGIFSRNTEDIDTLNARLYELVRAF